MERRLNVKMKRSKKRRRLGGAIPDRLFFLLFFRIVKCRWMWYNICIQIEEESIKMADENLSVVKEDNLGADEPEYIVHGEDSMVKFNAFQRKFLLL